MKNLLNSIKVSSLILLGLGSFTAVVLSGCATSDDSNLGKIGPDYEDPLSKQIRMQEAQSRVTRSLIR